jgi:hypothetical protein
VERLGVSISVGVDDRCVLRNAEHRTQYVSGVRLACAPQGLFSFDTNLRRDDGCVAVAEIALNAPIT